MNQTFWSQASLVKKIGLWTSDQIKNTIVPLVDLQTNETIYDIGAGFSPLGTQIIPFVLPNGSIIGFDKNNKTVDAANTYVNKQGLANHMTFKQADVYTIDELDLPLADVVMSQQLLVNLPDPITALEHMINVCKSSGRIFCIENINYGAYVHRPDLSWKTNLELSQIWQTLCTVGKEGYDFGDTTFGSNLPQVFYELSLHDISWQILSTGINIQPPYSAEFKKAFLENFKDDRKRIQELLETQWAPKTDLPTDKVDFFIELMVNSDYDEYAIKNNLFLTNWFYPFMVIVGWLEPKKKKIYSENVKLEL